jgi:hypothetical protein
MEGTIMDRAQWILDTTGPHCRWAHVQREIDAILAAFHAEAKQRAGDDWPDDPVGRWFLTVHWTNWDRLYDVVRAERKRLSDHAR